MGEEIKTLIRQRDSVTARLASFERFLNGILTSQGQEGIKDIKEPEVVIELQERISKQEFLFTEFDRIQNVIEIKSDDLIEQITIRESYENSHFSVISKAKILVAASVEPENRELGLDIDRQSSSGDSGSTNIANRRQINVKLPQIKLPIFNGSYDLWLEFRDTFISLVHNRSELDNVEKFHYVRAHLTGEAKQVIESIEFSSENYVIAWDLLCQRYNNTNLLVHNHLKQLFQGPVLNSESAGDLRKMSDNVSKHLRALKALKLPTEHWDTIVIFHLASKLDKKSEREWEVYKKGDTFPTLDEFKLFIKEKADILEKLSANRSDINKQHEQQKSSKNRQTSFVATTTADTIKCGYCKNNHYITNCSDFIKLSVNNKIEFCKIHKLCLNCLKPNHMSRFCRSSGCRKCNSRHNTLLHFEREQNGNSRSDFTEQRVVASNMSANRSMNDQPGTSCNLAQSQSVLLSTAIVLVRGFSGIYHRCRVLLDSGSQSNFISEEACNRLGLQKSDISISVKGITSVVSKITNKCHVTINSLHNNFEVSMVCLVLPTIAKEMPNWPVNIQSLNIPNHIKLADAGFHEPSGIDILLGAEIFFSLLSAGQLSLGKGQPTLQKTVLGWVIAGPVKQSNLVHCNLSTVDVQQQLEKFWKLEEPPADMHPILSHDELLCETIFKKTTTRNLDGKFVVDLPMREPPQVLGGSKNIAKKRFQSLENKLNKNHKMKLMYEDFMNEYIRMGHMSRVNEMLEDEIYYFPPHHGVLNEKSLTTKLRVVFDASCSTSTGLSLNDILLVGPTIQDDLLSIILRFRQHKVVVCADVEKMYRMVLVNPEQRNLQCILWRANSGDELETYRLNTVTYGTASAPFLAVRCLKQLAMDNEETHPDAAEAITHDFYVDDFISGADTVDDAIRLAVDVSAILRSGTFNLRKWTSNYPEVLSHVETKGELHNTVQLGEKGNTKLLGLFWSYQTDILLYTIKLDAKFKTISKRAVLSEISQIFDPLGLLGPCIILAKLILQKLWTLKLSWDESIPTSLGTQWSQFKEQLSELNLLEINRRVVCDNPTDIQLHGFADASQEAYGACIYVRSRDCYGNVNIQLLCAKAKVAPLKSQTIPRLELCAALLLSQLVRKISHSMTLQFSKLHLWSDSTVTLCWIKSSPHLLPQFVANRVANIQTLTDPNAWKHVSTQFNPADLLSRGVTPEKMLGHKLWWNGPEWLRKDENEWPQSQTVLTNNMSESVQSVSSFMAVSSVVKFDKFSNFNRLTRTMAYCTRFIYNCSHPNDRLSGPLNVKEQTDSILCLVKIVQHECFLDELIKLKENKVVKSRGIQGLNPFIDSQGIIRVGGRLQLSDFGYEKRHPILLSGKHHIVKLLFRYEHFKLLHAGPLHLLSSIRETFWVLSGRNLAKQTVHNCVRCFRMKPSIAHPIMGVLPKNRVTPSPPFYVTGIDYAGPFHLRDRRGRGSKLHKTYVSLFICFTTRAIHLELVSELSTDAFISCMRRFVSRRGKPRDVYSDNGTTFVGANTELAELGKCLKKNSKVLSDTFNNEGINWHFIPPLSPNFGGLWEAGVKSTKFHLKRVLSGANLTFEDFNTVLIQIEGILNSRPMTPMSSDPNDFTALTPSHFLIGRRLTTVADPNLIDIKVNRLSRFQYAQQLQQHFWTRWSKEFITELQTRVKWKKHQSDLQLGGLVLIREDNVPPSSWRLGRVTSVSSGPDGVNRVAVINTRTGVIKRSFAKICPLPMTD